MNDFLIFVVQISPLCPPLPSFYLGNFCSTKIQKWAKKGEKRLKMVKKLTYMLIKTDFLFLQYISAHFAHPFLTSD